MDVKTYWEKFTNEFPEYKNKAYTSWAFGVDSDHLVQLVKDGTKTATTSALTMYRLDDEPMPETGDVSIILESNDEPVCIIENIAVYQKPFKEIDEDFAFKEGEGDRSLSYWRQAHIAFFEPYYADYDISFNEDEIMVCEEFKCIYQ
ncbi:ASCH domain-containing protein [Staphylococcus massiliensis]|uniref:ASCH domain-containing protein n=1 Tax=Staphylococcus massiliensis S46 TaxID=1229783 RepID=K9B004_9STAP|nr:ASCH domain-containing protein [Staphylococcus massiliensis]EKU48142.1 hypothetical protein C273_05532 [Staphylococcus massiliensis S46]MCG3402107.1 ASCH domain-containing protein [Staphylococcus massiliensis]MCG3412942.1 ASCH domain-containing protein [Staphylococcus massiliensis]POA00957.1 ASCH domain-containing protein [Staphylococcus massiliensis CCUG 55927]